jgi:hypothetical protein
VRDGLRPESEAVSASYLVTARLGLFSRTHCLVGTEANTSITAWKCESDFAEQAVQWRPTRSLTFSVRTRQSMRNMPIHPASKVSKKTVLICQTSTITLASCG